MNHKNKNVNHKVVVVDQKNLNWIFGIAIIILLVAVSYAIGLVHWTYGKQMMQSERNEMMRGY